MAKQRKFCKGNVPDHHWWHLYANLLEQVELRRTCALPCWPSPALTWRCRPMPRPS